jgi:hypothetical protein
VGRPSSLGRANVGGANEVAVDRCEMSRLPEQVGGEQMGVTGEVSSPMSAGREGQTGGFRAGRIGESQQESFSEPGEPPDDVKVSSINSTLGDLRGTTFSQGTLNAGREQEMAAEKLLDSSKNSEEKLRQCDLRDGMFV